MDSWTLNFQNHFSQSHYGIYKSPLPSLHFAHAILTFSLLCSFIPVLKYFLPKFTFTVFLHFPQILHAK